MSSWRPGFAEPRSWSMPIARLPWNIVSRAREAYILGDYLEFEECLKEILDHPDRAKAMAQKGRQYVLEHFHWDRVTEKYQRLFERTWKTLKEPSPIFPGEAHVEKKPKPQTDRAIHQILPDFSYGDAIGNDVLEIQKVLRGWGLDSDIFAHHIHPQLTGSRPPLPGIPGSERFQPGVDLPFFHRFGSLGICPSPSGSKDHDLS